MRCTGYEMARYKGTQASHLYEKSMHTLCTIQWATAPGRSLNYPRPKSITHLRTFSDNGVYVALQLFLVILVSDQWRRVLIPYSYRQAPWGLLHAQGWLSWYTWDQQLYVVSERSSSSIPRKLHVAKWWKSQIRENFMLYSMPSYKLGLTTKISCFLWRDYELSDGLGGRTKVWTRVDPTTLPPHTVIFRV